MDFLKILNLISDVVLKQHLTMLTVNRNLHVWQMGHKFNCYHGYWSPPTAETIVKDIWQVFDIYIYLKTQNWCGQANFHLSFDLVHNLSTVIG